MAKRKAKFKRREPVDANRALGKVCKTAVNGTTESTPQNST